MLDELRLRGVVPAETAQMPGAILNVWRNAAAEEVQSKPLAVCDARSVDPDDFGKYHLVEGGEVARRRVGLNLSLPYSPRHRWYYYPRMRRDEAPVLHVRRAAPGAPALHHARRVRPVGHARRRAAPDVRHRAPCRLLLMPPTGTAYIEITRIRAQHRCERVGGRGGGLSSERGRR